MTTPVIEVAIVEAGFETYSLNIAGNIIPFEDSKVEIASSDFLEYAAQYMEPWKIDINYGVPGVSGIFKGMPSAAIYKLSTAWLNDISGDTPEFVADISRFMIVSTDGRIVFKPTIIRMLNEFIALGYVEDPNDYDSFGISIFIEGKPAYTNPSGATSDYQPTFLDIEIALPAIGELPPYNVVDEMPYIFYSNGTFEQPAI